MTTKALLADIEKFQARLKISQQQREKLEAFVALIADERNWHINHGVDGVPEEFNWAGDHNPVTEAQELLGVGPYAVLLEIIAAEGRNIPSDADGNSPDYMELVMAENAALYKRLGELIEALKPFAQIADWFGKQDRDDRSLYSFSHTHREYQTNPIHRMKVGDFRRAAAVVKGESGAEEESPLIARILQLLGEILEGASVEDIAGTLRSQPSTVWDALRQLERDGLVEQIDGWWFVKLLGKRK